MSNTREIADRDGLAKAWVNVDQTGTATALTSYNITSITDGGTGVTTANLTNNMSVVDYPRFTGGQVNAFADAGYYTADYSTSSMSLLAYASGIFADVANIGVAVSGDLA